MHPNRSDNWCCGGGAGLSAMDDIKQFRMEISGRKRLEKIRETHATYVATACSNCKRQLTQLMEQNGEQIEVGCVHAMLSTAIKVANRLPRGVCRGRPAVRTPPTGIAAAGALRRPDLRPRRSRR